MTDTTVLDLAPLTEPEAPPEPFVAMLLADVEPRIHGLIGAQYGDLEFDVGKSVRWSMFFQDDTFITDINTGEQRYWVVNWAASFPEAEHIVTGRNYFVTPAQWRKEQFTAGDMRFGYHDEDWCLFIDAHEGFSVDNRSLPDDYEAAPFKSFIYREVTRAEDASLDRVHLPFFVYLRYSDLQNVTYATQANSGGQELGVPAVQQAISVPWYLPYKSLPRLIKVSALRDPGFDWASLDQPVDLVDPGVKAQVISYGYAHWNRQDIPPGETTVPPLDATNDDGYRMRNLISKVRPIPGIPFGTPWNNPSTDPPNGTALPGPWCVDSTANVDPTLATTVEEQGHTPPAAVTSGIRVPLYDTVMRLNLRDGLWYERGMSGNMPLVWDAENQVWAPTFSPEEWPDKGTGSAREDAPPPSDTSLYLNGADGTYASTGDANYLDFANPESFTIAAVLALDDYHPVERKYIVSKWLPPVQCSWYWGLEPGGGMVLGISHDGSTPVEFSLDLSDGPALDLPGGQRIAAAVTYSTNLDNVDEVRFWLCPSFDLLNWELAGPAILVPNPDAFDLFTSTTEVQVGAYGGTEGNLAGYFRQISIRQGVGERDGQQYPGGNEVALMRGDITSNPSYDRYGNLWVNHGVWHYDEMPTP